MTINLAVFITILLTLVESTLDTRSRPSLKMLYIQSLSLFDAFRKSRPNTPCYPKSLRVHTL